MIDPSNPFNIPSMADRQEARCQGVLEQYVTPINEAILEGEWRFDNRYNYLYVHLPDHKWIDEQYFDELVRVYDQQYWIIEQHEDPSYPGKYHLRVFAKRKPEVSA